MRVQSVVLAALKEQADLEMQNAKIKARANEGESPKTIPLAPKKFFFSKDVTSALDKMSKKDEGPVGGSGGLEGTGRSRNAEREDQGPRQRGGKPEDDSAGSQKIFFFKGCDLGAGQDVEKG